MTQTDLPGALGLHEDEARHVRDARELSPLLQAHFDSILDIGCGGAWVDVLLAKKHGIKTVHLIDGDGTAEKIHGFRADTQAWADVQIGAANVREHTQAEVFTHKPHPATRVPPVDVVISLKSWGHHYPVDRYIDLVNACLRPGGILVIDARTRKRQSRAALSYLRQHGYKLIWSGGDSPRCVRMAFERCG
jgi:SAM-dependent methyltransferase